MSWQLIETAPKDGTVAIPLTQGQEAIIDLADLHLVERGAWHARPRRDGKGYYAANSLGIRMHRLLMNAPQEKIVDHIDGDGLNNRRSNLRIGTQSQNCVNRRMVKGRYLCGARPKRGKWQSYIKYKGRQKSLGYFDAEYLAHAAYLAAARDLHGDWMPLPTPPQEEAT